MKFRIDRDALAEAVAWTARTLPARPTVPVLAGMRLDVGDRLTLSSFDYEVSAQASVDVGAGEPGSALVSGRLLADITRSLPPEPVEVTSDGAKIVLACGGNTFTLQTLPVEDYPALPDLPPVAGTIASDAFAAAARQVAVAAARDDGLPLLTGMHVEIDDETVTLVCTDRYRVAVRELRWQPARPGVSATALVPAKSLADTARSLASGAEMSITLGGADDAGGMIGFDSGNRHITTRLLTEQFVKYNAYFPTEFSALAEVAAAPLAEAIKRVSLVAERNTPVRLSFSQGQVVLEAGTGDEAQAVATLAATLDGDDISVAFNPQFLLDGLAPLGSGTARLQLTTPTKPAVLTGRPTEGSESSAAPGYRYLAMPVRLSA